MQINKEFFSNPAVRIFLKLLITLSILFYLFSKLDLHIILKLLTRSNLWILLLSFIIFSSRNIFGAFRNKVLLAFKKFDFSVFTLTKLYFIGFFFNLFLPTVVGGDIARGYYLYKYSGGKEEAISSILVERALGILALMFLSFFSVIFASLYGFNVITNNLMKFIFISFGAGFLISLLFFYKKTEQYFERILPSIILTKFKSPVNVIRNVIEYNKSPAVLLNAFILSIVFQFFSIISTYLISLAMGCTTSFLYFLILLPVVWLVSMIPITINGLGLREGSFVFLFSTTGMSKEMAMTISILWLAQTVLLGVLGGVIFLLEGSSISTIKNYNSL